uniref:Peptidase C14, caspase catalytic subunit p20 n=1 Tax=Rhodopseudomonas palustris (strain BisA53) TaxID=316055 RepID=Q07RA2_RHOP5
MFRSMLCPAVVAGLLLVSQPAFAESRVALVIGQSAYHAVTPLPNPANDAKAVTQLLGDAGFEVTEAGDLSQNDLRRAVGDFAAKIAQKGPDTVALMFYAGHGLQVDGENFLMPVDIDPKREADIPLQAVRLNDVLNTLTSVPSKSRIILLDACRNNPFPEIGNTTGRGLALVDAKVNAAGTLLAYSTAPGDEAEDGSGGNSPYTAALLKAAREPGLSIEETFKRVRVSVNQVTSGRQTPWESSSLTSGFSFFANAADTPPTQEPKRSVEDWKNALKGKPAAEANELVVADGGEAAYEAFVALYADPPFGPLAREWLDLHYRMVAWNKAVLANTGAAYREFLAQFPDSDLSATARKLEERTRNRLTPGAVAGALAAIPASAAALTCPCTTPATPQLKKASLPKREVVDPPKKKGKTARRPPPPVDDDEVIVQRRVPVYDPPPVTVIGPALGGLRFGGGGGYRGPVGRGPVTGGNYGGRRY